MAGRLDGKVAMITGAASGIGLGTLELFISEGAKVIAADVQDEKGAMLERRFPDAVRYVRCDVTAEADIVAAVALAESAFGGLDIQFNNAGISDRMGGGGSIINTASIAGLQAGWGPIAYSTAKAGVVHMSRCAAAQLSPQGIRVNAICPGLIATSIFGATMGMTRDAADQMAALVAQNAQIAQPVKKPGLPQDIAQAALYLASDASAFVTGTHLVVDGGITVGSRHSWDPEAGSPFAAIFGESLMQMAPGSGQG